MIPLSKRRSRHYSVSFEGNKKILFSFIFLLALTIYILYIYIFGKRPVPERLTTMKQSICLYQTQTYRHTRAVRKKCAAWSAAVRFESLSGRRNIFYISVVFSDIFIRFFLTPCLAFSRFFIFFYLHSLSNGLMTLSAPLFLLWPPLFLLTALSHTL